MTDDVRRKQNCQDDHGWQGKSLLVVTGQASFRILTLGGKAVCKTKLQEAGEGAVSAAGEKESLQRKAQFRCALRGKCPRMENLSASKAPLEK